MSEHDSGWERHTIEQRRAWLRLSHVERLRWLEQAKQFKELALGAARHRRREDEEEKDPAKRTGPSGPIDGA
jgi:hypothetical protein